MQQWLSSVLIGGATVAFTASICLKALPVQQSASPAPASAATPAAAPDAADLRSVINRYCVGCHNARTRTADLALDTLDLNNVAENAETWEKVVQKLNANLMPPGGRPRPDAATSKNLVSYLETSLDNAANAKPNPGRTEALHRLNRVEYRNAVRDVLMLDMDVSALLPADDVSYGFDNIAGVQRMSPTLMERYVSAAQKISSVAVGASQRRVGTETFNIPPELHQDDQMDGLPFGTRGGSSFKFTFPQDGSYDIRAQVKRDAGASFDDIPIFDTPQRLELSIDGMPMHVYELPATGGGAGRGGGAGGGEPAGPRLNQRSLDSDWMVRVPVKAGPRTVVLTFLNRTPALLENLLEPFQKPVSGGSSAYYTTQKGAYLHTVQITGPYDVTSAGQTPSRERIFVCRPPRAADEDACAKKIIATMARRAFRRPVVDADLVSLVASYKEGRADGGFDVGVERAVESLLVSPEFLYRVEREPTPAKSELYPVSDLELASRLSFFLWSSIPDDTLLDLASSGKLRTPGVLEQQVRRMLADPRADALISNFVGQWLFLRNLPTVLPDPKRDQDFDEDLRQGFRKETELFAGSILRGDRSILDLLNANYTFVNERLAKHYGIPGIQGAHFRRVELTDDNRRGLLGQGSVLTVTSYPNRTSPVIRGKWILENLLGSQIPPPPPDVPVLKEKSNPAEEELPMRDRIAQHRANPACASCHAMMDPIGLSLENYDFVGRWRTVDEALIRVDASGVMPDGTKFEGPAGLRNVLTGNPDRFVRTVTEKMLTYALGRGVEYYDMPAVRKIMRESAKSDYRASALILNVVNSLPFEMRRRQQS